MLATRGQRGDTDKSSEADRVPEERPAHWEEDRHEDEDNITAADHVDRLWLYEVVVRWSVCGGWNNDDCSCSSASEAMLDGL
jgi:hypothetical protein